MPSRPTTAPTSDDSDGLPQSGQGKLDLRQPIDAHDWDALEEKFRGRMETCATEEKALHDEFERWLVVFNAWAQTGINTEFQRAAKRFRTRVHHVQNAEERLEQKRQHYTKVVGAFQSALALLSQH